MLECKHKIETLYNKIKFAENLIKSEQGNESSNNQPNQIRWEKVIVNGTDATNELNLNYVNIKCRLTSSIINPQPKEAIELLKNFIKPTLSSIHLYPITGNEIIKTSATLKNKSLLYFLSFQ